MTYHQFQNEDGDSYGSFEVFYYYDSTGTQSRSGWYWWACYPGCLPDGDHYGPFGTEEEAIENAQLC